MKNRSSSVELLGWFFVFGVFSTVFGFSFGVWRLVSLCFIVLFWLFVF